MAFPSGAMNNTMVALGVMSLLLALGYRLPGNMAVETGKEAESARQEPGK